jgi:hypothetical protein
MKRLGKSHIFFESIPPGQFNIICSFIAVSKVSYNHYRCSDKILRKCIMPCIMHNAHACRYSHAHGAQVDQNSLCSIPTVHVSEQRSINMPLTYCRCSLRRKTSSLSTFFVIASIGLSRQLGMSLLQKVNEV